MNRIFTVLGIFLLFSFHLDAQTITGVSIPAGNYKINDAITINFVSANTAGTALVAGSTVNGVALTGFTNLTGGNYSAIYTVVATNTDRASVGVIPINIGLTSGTDGPFFTAAATSGGTVTIDANSPTVSSIVKASTDPSNATNVNFTVTFNELVDATTLNTADFDLTLTGGVTATVNSVTPTTGTSTTFTVNVNAISTNEGTLRLNKTNNAYSDAIGNSSTTTFSSGEVYTIDRLAPSVSSIIKASTDPSNATNVNFTVTFSELVDATTLTTADFDLTLTGGVTATVNSVTPTTGTSTTFTVNVNTISTNEGTLRLNKTNNAYSDAIGNSSTATFSPGAGGTYSIDRLAQSVSSIVRASTNPSNATNVNFTVTFSELIDATTITTADFDLTLTGGVTATINSVSPTTGTSTTFTVNVNAISANEGTLRLNKTNDAYSDAMGNSSTTTFSAGEVYTIDRLAPTVSGIVRASTDPTGASNVDFTVTFSELVDATTLTTADFDLTVTGGVTATVNSVTPASGTSATFTVNVNAISNNQGTLQLNKTNNAYSDAIGNSSTATFSAGEVYTIDRLAPTADAPDAFQTVQSLKSGATSASQVRSTENGAIYLVKNGTAVSSQAQINAAVTAKNAFLGRAVAVANTGYTITIPIASLINDGNYNIVAVDGAGNVSTPSSGADSWLTVDNTAPTVAITLVSASPTTATALDFTITFSEPVTGVDLADFLLATGTANDATGNIANLSGTGAVYTVTVNSITGQNSGGSNGILNLDLIASPGISDGASNAFAGSVTTDNQYLVDNTKPALSPDVMSLQLNGAAAETITFTLNEDLSIGDGTDIKNGFSVSSGGIASAIYTASTKKVTMTSTANGQWNTPPTVSYVRTTGLYTDVIGNQLQDITAHLVEQLTVTMIAGDIAFTSFRSANTSNQPDQFSIVLLRSIPANTTIYFTDRGWNTTTSTLIDFTDDGLFSWKSSTAVPAGTEIVFTGTNNPSNTNNNFTSSLPSYGAVTNDADKLFIRTSGDAILAYQTDGTSIFFLAAVSYGNANPAWVVTGIPSNQDESGNPGLPATATIIAGDKDNGAYLRTASASTYTGSATELRALISNISNWDIDNTEANVDLPGDTQPSVWSSFPVLNNPNSLNYVIRPKINSVNIPDVAMKIGDAVTATISVDDDASATPVTLTSGTVGGFTLGSFARINATTYTAQFTVTEGGTDVAAGSNVPVANLVVQNGVGISNTAFSGNDNPAGAADAIDAHSPYVVSINRNTTATTTTTYSGNTGTTATSVVFRVTFSENMANATLAANDFAVIAASGLTGAPSINNINAVTGTSVFDVTVTGYTGTGTIGLNYVDSEAGSGGSVTDLIGNPTKSAALAANGSFTGQTFSIVLPTPASEVFTLTESNVTGNSVTLTWNPTNPLPAPTNYLVIASPATPPTAPADGTPVADGIYAINLPVGTNTHTFNSLQSGTSYNFAVYKYALSPNNTPINIDFETTSPAIKNAVVTNTATVSAIQLSSTPIAISSLRNSSLNSESVMQFKIFDDGLDPLSPNVMTLQLNGLSPEKIVFNLRDELTLLEGATVIGFSTSTGTLASAVYTGKGTTNTITLTNVSNGTWTSGTTVSYSSAGTANAQFVNLGKMQAISAHPLGLIKDNVVTYFSDGTFNVPLGVTNLTVEAWGGGGAGGSGVGGTFYDAGGGGGGGGYSKSSFAVTSGTGYPVTIGQGGSTSPGFGAISGPGTQSSFGGVVIANGGTGGFNNSAGNKGLGGVGAVIGTGDIAYAGGGGNAGTLGSGVSNPGLGGGGGSSAGTGGNGNSAIGATGGSAPSGGGSGGSGLINGTAINGTFPGGGGGASGNGNGGLGADGQIRITYDQLINPVASDWTGDNSPFKFSQLIITQGAGTSAALVGNLDDIIDVNGAELFDGTNTSIGTVNGSTITFSSLTPTGTASDVGVVPDANGSASSKTYTLKIWLKNINATNPALAATIDGMTLDFTVAPANLVYDDATNSNQKSSRLAANHPSLTSGANTIDVDATKLDFTTSPIPSVFVLANVTAASALPDLLTRPVVRARDARGNTDKDYSASAASLTVSNGGSLPMVNSTLSINAGVGMFSSTFQYQDDGVGTLTVSDGAGPLADAVSSPVAVVYSNTTKITAGAGNEPSTFPSTFTSTYAQRAFDFAIDEDNLSGGDGSPTRISQLVITAGAGNDITDWSQALDGAILYDPANAFFPYPVGTIGTNTITFSGIDFSNTDRAGYIADNARKNYELYVWLKPALGSTLPSTIDNLNFAFEVLDDNIALEPLSSLFTGSESASSGSTNNEVTVVATKLRFATNPAPTLLVGKDISAQLPVPVVEALDANNNRDLGYNSATVTVTNSGSLTMANIPGNASFINGLLTFPGTFKFTTTGSGVTLTVASTGPSIVTSTSSTSFDVRGGDAGTITASSALTEPATISSLVDLTHTPAGLPVFDFTINDDPAGTPAGEDDGNPTQLTSLFITSGVGNTVLGWDDAFATATLSDGTNTVTVTNIDASDYFYFDLSSLTGQALGLIADNGSKTYTLRVWLKTALGGMLPTTIDGENFVFDVQKTNITTSVNSSKILTGQNQNSDAAKNKVDVTATRIDYSQLDATDNFISPYSTANFPASGSIFTDFIPRLGVEAHDANSNRDLGFSGSITFFAPVTAGVTTQNDPSGAFNAGTLKFPANFNYTAGNNQDGKLRMSAGGISNQDSPTINIISSFESGLTSLDAATSVTNIDYENFQESLNITGLSDGYTLGRLRLNDGAQDGIPGDDDGAATVLKDLTLGISNPQSIRRIAVYQDIAGIWTEVEEKVYADIVITGGYGQITFSNLGITATDAIGFKDIRILASFNNLITNITDNDTIQVSVLDAVAGVGSKFYSLVAPTTRIGGVLKTNLTFPPAATSLMAGAIGPLNKIEVLATSLDFVTQPSDFAGKQEPINGSVGTSPGGSTGIVHARDKFALIDTDFNDAATVTATANPILYPTAFVKGILDLTGMQYQNAGNGKLRVTTGSPVVILDSDVISSGNSIASEPVDVIHVTAVEDQTGVYLQESLRGGTANTRIFGINFLAEHKTGTEPSLTSFSIIFRKEDGSPYPYTSSSLGTIFKNFKLYDAGGLISPGDYTLTEGQTQALISTGAPLSSKDKLTYTLTSAAPLYSANKSFYLSVDVDVSVSVGTASIIPMLVDHGYTSPNTNNHIGTTIGSSTADVIGITRKFASTKPPILVYTNPANGKLNVNISLDTIKVKFDVPVVSFDGEVKVYNRETGTLRATFKATPTTGLYQPGPLKPQVVDTLKFVAPVGFDFKPDTVYYVTIEKGVFSNTDATQRKGISDEGFNLYGGISYSGTFYFKGSSLIAPKLLSSDDTKYYYTPSTATFNFEFDRPGKVHYMVVHSTTPAAAPATVTNNQILGIEPYVTSTIIARDSTIIDHITPNLQFATINANLNNGINYYVYAFAENDAEPLPVKTSKPYGSAANLFAAGANGPTLIIQKTNTNTAAYNNPRFEICVNSSVKMEEPIIISEPALNNVGFRKYSNNGTGIATGVNAYSSTISPVVSSYVTNQRYLVTFNNANTGASTIQLNGLGAKTLTLSGSALLAGDIIAGQKYFLLYNGTNFEVSSAIQNFYVLLPTGFQYDVTKKPTVSFNGTDFETIPSGIGINSVSFKNSALLEINYINNESGNLDNIIISDLYLISNSVDVGGDIVRFGGNGLASVPEEKVLARISSSAGESITFTNSYEKAFAPWPYTQIEKTITYMPDNFASIVRLIPVPKEGDYGSSFFTGSGLTNDELTLSAVTLDASFNITLTHTDQNGCTTNTVEQYLVYDHTKVIPELLKTPAAAAYKVSGTKIGLIPGVTDPVSNIPGLPAQTINVSDSVSFAGLAGYQLIDLYAAIPERVKNSNQFIKYTLDTIGWQKIVHGIPKSIIERPNTTLGQVFKTYNWEYSNLINKDSTDAEGVLYPYNPDVNINNNFARVVKSSGTGNGKTFFEAGSLGIIEFTGVYQSTADYGVFIPFRQEVELFIPAVPVIEVDGESDIAGNTPIFCEKGSSFIITGYPLANSSEVTGFFTLKDSVSNTPIIDAGFIDNGNGTASFNPSSSVLKNNYKSIKVEYTFKQNDSPAVGTGILYIRVTPNPLPDFTTTTLCEDLNVTFTDTTPLNPLAPDVFNEKWLWNFGDPSSTAKTDTLKTPVHKYLDSGLKSPVTLSVITNFGCASVLPKSVSLEIGGTPNVGFTFEGVSVNDQIAFTNASTVTSNDSFGKLDWTFGDGATQLVTSGFAAVQNHSYLLPNHYDVMLKVTSTIGCVNEKSQRIVVLSNATPTPIDSYIEHFEVNNGKWISSSVPTSSYKNNRSTWEIGNPTSAVIKITDATTFGNGVAKTNLDSTYRAQETSAFYSPSFDLSQLSRPMISFNSLTQMEVGDGVVVQYSVDNKNVADPDKKWYVLGDNLNEGVDWFNTSGITAKPGGQPDKDFGWSGFDKSEWSESKHVIANASGKADVVGKTRVVFRFALASAKQGAADITHDGFAFDNFRIGERTRTILLENFTSTNGKDATQNGTIKTENKYLSDFQNSGFGTTVVKLNYHTGFTGTDPFNVDNPADPSARALYYNVKDVPYAMLDGSRPVGATLFSTWGQQAYDTQTLQLGQADISVPPTSLTTNADGSIKFDVKVTALYDLPANTIVHVALIEQSVTGGLSAIQSAQVKTGESNFDFVLKKMLPNALGTRLGTVLAKDEFRTFPDFEYYPDPSKLYATSNDLAIVVFLQNEDTKLIYQTEYINGISDPPTVTGLENGLRIEDVTFYPNPADNELNILLPRKAIGDVTIQLFDQVGKSVLNSTIKNGDQKCTLNVQGLAESMYLMRLVENGEITMKKVMVVHQN